MADFTLEALKDEIVNDPEALGYKNVNDTWTGGVNPPKGDQVIADLINTKNLVIDRSSVEMEQIRGITEEEWYDGLSPDEQEYLRWQTPNSGLWKMTPATKLLLTGSQPADNGVVGASVPADSFWLATDRTGAIAAMLPLIEIVGSRAGVLWGEGVSISAGQVGRAFNLI